MINFDKLEKAKFFAKTDMGPFHVASQKFFFRHAEKFYFVIFT